MLPDIDVFNKKYTDAMQLDDDITEFETNVPDRRTKEYKIWLSKINHLYNLYNQKVKFKCYKMLK